jgi:gas vesicle protein
MGDKKLSPLLLGLGVVAGAAGALFLSKKENRSKAMKTMNKAAQSSKSWLSQFVEDMNALSDQPVDDTPKKKRPTSKKSK